MKNSPSDIRASAHAGMPSARLPSGTFRVNRVYGEINFLKSMSREKMDCQYFGNCQKMTCVLELLKS